MAGKTHYDVLSVRPEATTDEIRRAYHKLARDHHPDRFKDPAQKRQAEEVFTGMTEAFNVLTDVERRRAYDAKLKQPVSGETSAQTEAKSYFRGGQAKLAEKNAKDAVRLFKAAVHLDSTQGTHHAFLAQALEADGSPGDAARAWDEAIRREPYNPLYYRMAGQCLERAGMLVRAKRMYEAAVKWDKSDSESAEALRRLAGGDDKKGGLLSGLFKRQ